MNSNNGSLLGGLSIRTENLLLLRLTTTTAGSSTLLSLASWRWSVLLLLGSLSSGLLGSLLSLLGSLLSIFLGFRSGLRGSLVSFLLGSLLSPLGSFLGIFLGFRSGLRGSLLSFLLSFLGSLLCIFLSFGSSLGGFGSCLLSCDLSLLGFLVLGELFGTPISLLGPFCSAV
jgi:hypothetical protein